MKGFVFAPAEKLLVSQGTLRAPEAEVTEENTRSLYIDTFMEKG